MENPQVKNGAKRRQNQEWEHKEAPKRGEGQG